MNTYSLEEFRDKMKEKIAKLDINPNYEENPAYYTILGDIENFISSMNLGDKIKDIIVKEKDGKISFSCIEYGKKYFMEISCPSKDEIFIRKSTEEPEYNSGVITETEAFISDKGFMLVKTKGNATYIKQGKVDKELTISPWIEESYYTAGGVKRDYKYKRFHEFHFRNNEPFKCVWGLGYTDFGVNDSSYAESYSLYRTGIDTAHCYWEAPQGHRKLNAEVPIHSEYGYREMTVNGNLANMKSLAENGEYIIPAVSSEEVQKMLSREHCKKAREELSKYYAEKREEYSYDASKDPDFYCEGFDPRVPKR